MLYISLVGNFLIAITKSSKIRRHDDESVDDIAEMQKGRRRNDEKDQKRKEKEAIRGLRQSAISALLCSIVRPRLRLRRSKVTGILEFELKASENGHKEAILKLF
uniref:BHLH domain-containing protein n=1 Tax=Caenorhabditis tropicalis TaxID=1561998 RepID=A0A1I7TL13_9PELO